ncbi:GAF domain-containing protein [Maricaulis sp. CAU 1757]
MLDEGRQQALDRTGLIEAGREPGFDHLVRLAAHALHTKIALISLIDRDRQWFKARHGLEVEETARCYAFCDHTIRNSDVMVIPDALEDPRFADNPLVTGEPNIRFYAGAPLITHEGYALGSLCVIDTEPRHDFGPAERTILQELAEAVMLQVASVSRDRAVHDLEVIIEELRRRMGSLFTHVSFLVSTLDQDETDTDRLVHRLRDCIGSLSRTQAAFAANRWQALPLHRLCTAALGPFTQDEGLPLLNIEGGNPAAVSERAAFVLTLMLHELATNSVQHGALGRGVGRISLGWQVSNGVRIYWSESGVASGNGPVSTVSQGFGSTVLEKIVPDALGGEGRLVRPERGGLSYELTVPASRVLERSESQAEA